MSKLGNLKKIYQNNRLIHLPLYRITRSKSYYETMTFLHETENWSKKKMDNWVLSQLRSIVDYAVKNDPYYRTIYGMIGLKSGKDIVTYSDFENLPTVSKSTIKEHFSDFISEEFGLKYKEYCTSGTQLPFSFLLDRCYVGREQAYFDYYWKKMGGYSPAKDRCIVLRGGGKNDKHYEMNQIYNYKIFDSDSSSDSSLLLYYDKEIRKFNSRFMQAYPSSLYGLAKNYLLSGLKAPSFDVIFLGSENVLDDQLQTIKKCFNPHRILYHYGHSEETLLGIKYENDNGYGFFPQYGYCELLDNFGKTVSCHEFGELTGTTWSKIMPFIRYRTNDFAVRGDILDTQFPFNAFHVEKIEGRQQEFVIRSDSVRVSIVSICSEHMPVMSQIKEIQFEQFKAGELFLNCVFYDELNKSRISSQIIAAMEKKFEGKVKCHVKEVARVKKTNNGKTIMLIQHVY